MWGIYIVFIKQRVVPLHPSFWSSIYHPTISFLTLPTNFFFTSLTNGIHSEGNSHGDITQPCLNSLLNSKLSLNFTLVLSHMPDTSCTSLPCLDYHQLQKNSRLAITTLVYFNCITVCTFEIYTPSPSSYFLDYLLPQLYYSKILVNTWLPFFLQAPCSSRTFASVTCTAQVLIAYWCTGLKFLWFHIITCVFNLSCTVLSYLLTHVIQEFDTPFCLPASPLHNT